MGIGEGAADSSKELETLGNRVLVFVAEGVDCLPFDVLHYEIRQSVSGGTTVEKARDVWMVERSKDLAFVAKVADDRICVHPTLY
jgi:hypothetical protein